MAKKRGTMAPTQAAYREVQLHPEWDGTTALEGDVSYVSASTLMSVLAKPALEIWSRQEVARKVLAEWNMLDALRQTSAEQAQHWIEQAQWHAYRGRLSATERGEAIHSCLEAWLSGHATPNVPEEVWPHLEHLAKAVERLNLRRVHAERVVYSVYGDPCPSPVGWAGRFDLIAEISGFDAPVMLDLKTAGEDASPSGHKKKPYADSLVMQLGAYRHAGRMAQHFPRTIRGKGSGRIYLLSEQEEATLVDAPAVGYCAVLYSTPKRCDLRVVDVPDDIVGEIRAAVRLYWFLYGGRLKGRLQRRSFTTEGLT